MPHTSSIPDQMGETGPVYMPQPTMGIPDYEAKMDIVREVYSIMQQSLCIPIDLFHRDISVILHQELPFLQEVMRDRLSPPRSESSMNATITDILEGTYSMQSLARYFLLCGPDPVVDVPPRIWEGPGPGVKCLVTGTPDAVRSHILPPRWVGGQQQHQQTFRKFCLPDRGLRISTPERNELMGLILGGDTSPLEELWNKVPLSETMHEWWRRAVWAFEVLHEPVLDPDNVPRTTTVTLAFHWMRVPAPGCEVYAKSLAYRETEEGGRELDPVCEKLQSAEPVVRHHDTSRLLATGDVIQVPVNGEDARKFAMAMRLQWDLINLAATARAAGRPELLYDDLESILLSYNPLEEDYEPY